MSKNYIQYSVCISHEQKFQFHVGEMKLSMQDFFCTRVVYVSAVLADRHKEDCRM